jgi:hypothetical protein
MFERFSHFLAYGATDQKTVIDLLGKYEGLIVPGTVAAFQREGTGGFVLSLSAIPESPPYLIDPRFPLFQKTLESPKKSHIALANLLGAPGLIGLVDPQPSDFDDELVQTVARNWVEFNRNYEQKQAGKFEKYAKRLEEEIDQEAAHGPSGILAPYLVSQGEEWWERSDALMKATVEAAGEGENVLRVVAVAAAAELDGRLGQIADERAVLWVSGLKELEADSQELAAYGEAIRAAQGRGQSTFALYGGFFAVLLAGLGLRGACHGIGYGEHRSWPELPRSGPPPARYYAPRFHRYIGQDLAYQLWSRDAELTACACPICDNGSPVLGYHDLMKHSVFARQAEIERWGALDLADSASQLDAEREELEEALGEIELPEPLRDPVERATLHLPRWVEALNQLRAE